MLWGCLVVSLFWGVTNPFLRHYSKGMDGKGVAQDFLFLGSRVGYLLALLVNWVGSALFYVLLRDGDLSVVAPLANGMTFAVTMLCGWLVFGERAGARGVLGIALVGAGTAVMTSR